MPTASPQNSTTGRRFRAPRWVRRGLRLVDSVAPALAENVVQRWYFRPGRLAVTPAQRQLLELGHRFELELDGRAVVGRRWGDTGRTVWLVHGWGGHLGQLTPYVEPLVQRGFRVLGFDWPAHGESGGERSSLAHAHRALLQLQRFVGDPHGLIAHSFGAAATTLALGTGLHAQRAVYQAPVARLAPYLEQFASALDLSPDMNQRFISRSEAWLEAPFADFEPLRFAPKIRTPVLLLHSRDDRDVPLAEGELLASHWPGATLVTTDGLGHRRLLQDPSCVAQTVAFLAQ